MRALLNPPHKAILQVTCMSPSVLGRVDRVGVEGRGAQQHARQRATRPQAFEPASEFLGFQPPAFVQDLALADARHRDLLLRGR